MKYFVETKNETELSSIVPSVTNSVFEIESDVIVGSLYTVINPPDLRHWPDRKLSKIVIRQMWEEDID